MEVQGLLTGRADGGAGASWLARVTAQGGAGLMREAAKSGEERERREVLTGRSIAMWRPRQRNHPPKQPNG